VSTLWTPEGEHPVGRDEAAAAPPRGTAPDGPADASSAQEGAERLRQDLLAAPVEDIVANHCFGLFQLAALHLDERPPNLENARLAIDALGGIVDAVGDRLGENTDTMRDALASIRLAFVELSKATDGEASPAEGSDS
jgi:hypothetical protein